MTVSWIFLTYNRAEIVRQSLEHNMATAGAKWDELVWCDNGSTDQVRDVVMPHATTAILNKENLGVAKGYNRAMGLATGDYIVITGCDTLMPKNWLATFLEHMENSEAGVVCVYTRPREQVQERYQWAAITYDGRVYQEVWPLERRIFRRPLLSQVGYFPEDLGLYGYDDICWAKRALKVCAAQGQACYVLPELAVHLGTEGVSTHDGKDARAYHEFKRREVDAPHKAKVLAARELLGWPRFSPFL